MPTAVVGTVGLCSKLGRRVGCCSRLGSSCSGLIPCRTILAWSQMDVDLFGVFLDMDLFLNLFFECLVVIGCWIELAGLYLGSCVE